MIGLGRIRSTGDILSPYGNLMGPVPQVDHAHQQAEGCQDGHSQALVPGAHVVGELVPAVLIARLLRMPTELLVELVEQPEDQSTDIEEDGEQASTSWKRGKGPGGLGCHSPRFNKMARAAGVKQMEYSATHHSRAGWCRYTEV